MSSQLDILALEPFYGGQRRSMLETVTRCSRHRWTVLKLPPRRIERRLTAAAHWFGEQLQRHWSGKIDLVFASEAMNLPDLFRLVPVLSRKPSIVYFHDNQLPSANGGEEGPLDLVNVSTAMAATAAWFNSEFHRRTFLNRAANVLFRHPEIAQLGAGDALTLKAQTVPPPIDVHLAHDAAHRAPDGRKPRAVFVETRDAQVGWLNAAFTKLKDLGEPFELITVGPAEGVAADLPRRTVPEQDDHAIAAALAEAAVFASVKPAANHDFHAVRALAAGCWPVLPRAAVYPEILAEPLHRACLYDPTPDGLLRSIEDAWHLSRPADHAATLRSSLVKFDPTPACKAIDKRIEELVAGRASRR